MTSSPRPPAGRSSRVLTAGFAGQFSGLLTAGRCGVGAWTMFFRAVLFVWDLKTSCDVGARNQPFTWARISCCLGAGGLGQQQA
jgi:hypothetical protein